MLAFDSTGGGLSGVSATPLLAAGKHPTAAATLVRMPIATSGEFSYTLYAGPMEYDRLKRIGHDFDDVNPYGLPGFRTLIRFFAAPVRWLLVWMHESLHLSYGFVLIAFGLLVRLLLWPLNQKAMRANTALQALQPQLQRIQEQYKSDPATLQKKMFELYKENGVNPLGGCWPMLLPMPVLFALFFVLGNSIELRGVPFLWFPDLARPDPVLHHPGAERHLDVRADEGGADGDPAHGADEDAGADDDLHDAGHDHRSSASTSRRGSTCTGQ